MFCQGEAVQGLDGFWVFSVCVFALVIVFYRGLRGSSYQHFMPATISPPAKCHFYDVSQAGK